MMALYFFLIASGILCAVIEGLLLANVVINDLKKSLIEINENSKLKENHSQATEQFTDFVQIHTLVNELSNIEFSMKKKIFISMGIIFIRLLNELLVIIEQMGMIFFTWCAICVCAGMLLVQNEIVELKVFFGFVEFCKFKAN